MNRKDMLGFQIKTLDNLFFRNMIAYEASQRGMDEVTVMHGWILGFLFENSEREIFQKDIETEFSIARSTRKYCKADGEKRIYLPGIRGAGCPFKETGADRKRQKDS